MISEIIIGVLVSYSVVKAIGFLHFVLYGLIMPKVFKKYDRSGDLYFMVGGYWIYNYLLRQKNMYQQPYEITVIHDDTEHK